MITNSQWSEVMRIKDLAMGDKAVSDAELLEAAMNGRDVNPATVKQLLTFVRFAFGRSGPRPSDSTVTARFERVIFPFLEATTSPADLALLKNPKPYTGPSALLDDRGD